MSPRQLELIEQLRDELDYDDDGIEDVADNLLGRQRSSNKWTELNSQEASSIIDELINLKRRGDYE